MVLPSEPTHTHSLTRAHKTAYRYATHTPTKAHTQTDTHSHFPSIREVQSDEIFDLIDSNGDGAISLEELRAHLISLGYQPETIDSLFVELDHNSDG